MAGRRQSSRFGTQDGRGAFIVAFELDGTPFKIVWPVLPTRGDNERAARVQAATFLYHDCKARVLSAAVLQCLEHSERFLATCCCPTDRLPRM